MQYRIHLFKPRNRIAAAESFYAVDDDEAAEMAFDLYSLSSDVVTGYELWHGAVCLIQALEQPQPMHHNLEDALTRRQERMLEHEQRLQSNFACIRESRKLMATVTALLEKRG
jgi:hypothetical protein